MVPKKQASLRVAIVTANASTAHQLAQLLSEQGIGAARASLPTPSVTNATAFELYVVAEPIAETLEALERSAWRRDVSILVTTQGRAPEARARWLDAGADDCLSFPLNAVELAARANALLRRVSDRSSRSGVVSVGKLELQLRQRDAYLRGKRLELTSNEFELLATLAQSAGQVLSRDRLLELTKGSSDEAFDRCIDVQVSRLRAKLGDDSRAPQLLKTVRGRGYLLRDM